ncbi:MAG: mechanosensitive ion channel family protein [Treponema sp.]|nr:mechanosensitive ion channel family protein [Candidatus Treponema caballi]
MEETLIDISGAAVSAANETIVKQTTGIVSWFKQMMTWETLFKALGAFLVICIIWIAYRLIRKGIRSIPEKKLPAARSELVQRALKYLFYVVIILYILSLFGINLAAIWGAAGIAGIALGFAAQTSVSNLISGLFVISEGSIHVGDTIIVDDVTGVVDEIKLLSIRVHTYDNQMVRIPSSKIIDSCLTNNSYHKVRRMTIPVSIDYASDMEKALEVLSKAPELCPTVVKKPAPAVWYDGFDGRGINMVVAVWFKPDDYTKTRNDIHIAIKKVLDENNIVIPISQMDVHLVNADAQGDEA